MADIAENITIDNKFLQKENGTMEHLQADVTCSKDIGKTTYIQPNITCIIFA